jgi:hypothetical protein
VQIEKLKSSLGIDPKVYVGYQLTLSERQRKQGDIMKNMETL